MYCTRAAVSIAMHLHVIDRLDSRFDLVDFFTFEISQQNAID
jgi:hypothetical protein